MASVEVDPCQVLDILIQKHSKLKKHATTDAKQAAKALDEMQSHIKDEVKYITQQIVDKSKADSEQKEKEEEEEEKDSNSLQIVFHLTGFGKFGEIVDNPTTDIMKSLPDYISSSHGIPKNVSIPTMKVLHVSGENSRKQLMEIRESNKSDDDDSGNAVYVYLHFGVAASRKVLSLESTAYNCANFKDHPDELGWEPHQETIIKENGNIYHELKSTLPIDTLESVLMQKGYEVEKSTDPGRYVCNWILYHSLHFSAGKSNEYNMFVHVPKFDEIDQDTQCKFAVDLIAEIAKLISWKHS